MRKKAFQKQSGEMKPRIESLYQAIYEKLRIGRCGAKFSSSFSQSGPQRGPGPDLLPKSRSVVPMLISVRFQTPPVTSPTIQSPPSPNRAGPVPAAAPPRPAAPRAAAPPPHLGPGAARGGHDVSRGESRSRRLSDRGRHHWHDAPQPPAPPAAASAQPAPSPSESESAQAAGRAWPPPRPAGSLLVRARRLRAAAGGREFKFRAWSPRPGYQSFMIHHDTVTTVTVTVTVTLHWHTVCQA